MLTTPYHGLSVPDSVSTSLTVLLPLPSVAPAYFESAFIKAEDSEPRKGLGQKEQEEQAQAGLLRLTGKSERKGLETGSGG